MTAVTIQSNKIVVNEIKDNQALLEPFYGKNQTFWPTQYLSSLLVILGGSKSDLLIHLCQNQKSQMFTFWYYTFKMPISDPSGDVGPMISWVKGFVGSQQVQSVVPVFLALAAHTLAADRQSIPGCSAHGGMWASGSPPLLRHGHSGAQALNSQSRFLSGLWKLKKFNSSQHL